MHATRRPRIALLVVLALVGACLLPQAAVAILDGGGNTPPEAVADEINTAEGTPGDANVLANDLDPDGDTLSILSWTQATYGSVTCGATDCVYTPTDIGFSGSDSFTYTVSDGNGGTDVGDVLVTVTPTNEQPVATDDFLTTAEDTQGSVNVLANDTDDDGDPLVVETLTPVADHGTVSCTSGGSCTYTPDADFAGTDTFTYSISDGQGGADAGDVAVTVTPVNDGPNAVDDTLTTSEDTQGSLNVRVNDTDVDGDTLLVTTLAPDAAHGSVACLAGGGCTYAPDADYNGPDSFEYAISDGHGGTDTATVTITVTPENTAPVAAEDTIGTVEDDADSTNVLVNDTDVDGDTLSVSSPTPAAAHGTVSCQPTGSCTYTPDANFSGEDAFEYTVSDGRGKFATGLVRVAIAPANDDPTAVGDVLSTAEEAGTIGNVLLNDWDVDGDTPAVVDWTDGAHGEVTCEENGTCFYTPALDYAGADAFTYTISDGHGGTDTGSVSITITNLNDAPVAADDSLTVVQDTPENINVLLNDVDVDGDTLSVEAESDTEHGTFACASDGLCTYTPDPGYLGPDNFIYSVSDGTVTDEGLVSVTVEEPNTAPGCAKVRPSKTKLWPPQHQLVVISLSGATDPDGDALTFAITSVTQDEKTKLNKTDKKPDAVRVPGKPFQIKLRAERDPKANGRVYRVRYRVSDGRGGTCTGVEKVGVPIKQAKKAVETAKSFNSFR